MLPPSPGAAPHFEETDAFLIGSPIWGLSSATRHQVQLLHDAATAWRSASALTSNTPSFQRRSLIGVTQLAGELSNQIQIQRLNVVATAWRSAEALIMHTVRAMTVSSAQLVQ